MTTVWPRQRRRTELQSCLHDDCGCRELIRPPFSPDFLAGEADPGSLCLLTDGEIDALADEVETTDYDVEALKKR